MASYRSRDAENERVGSLMRRLTRPDAGLRQARQRVFFVARLRGGVGSSAMVEAHGPGVVRKCPVRFDYGLLVRQPPFEMLLVGPGRRGAATA